MVPQEGTFWPVPWYLTAREAQFTLYLYLRFTFLSFGSVWFCFLCRDVMCSAVVCCTVWLRTEVLTIGVTDHFDYSSHAKTVIHFVFIRPTTTKAS